jgi:hypothetical protein
MTTPPRPRTKTTHRFSYDWVSDATRADYEAMLDVDAVRFAQWRHRTHGPTMPSLERSFRAWWLTVGPTSFATPDDAFRYKRELWACLERAAALRDAGTTFSTTHAGDAVTYVDLGAYPDGPLHVYCDEGGSPEHPVVDSEVTES